ncbi:MAG: sensor histidine kinase, partial [Myxococcota bacterium]
DVTPELERQQRLEARRFAAIVWLGWGTYAVAYALAVTIEARTTWLALARWTTHIGAGLIVGLLLIRVLPKLRRWEGWPAHIVFAAATTVTWAVVSGLMLDLLTGSSRALESLTRHPGRARWQLLAGGMMYALIVAGAQWRRAAQSLSQARASAEHEARLRTEAELRALRSQLDPHFLFNTLHSLVSLARQAPQEVEAGLERLASLLRYTLRTQESGRDLVVFSAEWGFVSDYLELERTRLGDRLALRIDVADTVYGVELPPFTLQPLVENAVKHAVAIRETPTEVAIEAAVDEDCLVLTVSDDGPGAPGDPLESPTSGRRGIGLAAIRDRLRLSYGPAASMSITTAPEAGFTVQLRIPLEHA